MPVVSCESFFLMCVVHSLHLHCPGGPARPPSSLQLKDSQMAHAVSLSGRLTLRPGINNNANRLRSDPTEIRFPTVNCIGVSLAPTAAGTSISAYFSLFHACASPCLVNLMIGCAMHVFVWLLLLFSLLLCSIWALNGHATDKLLVPCDCRQVGTGC